MQQFRIMSDGLKEGEELILDEKLDPSFLDLSKDDELKISSSVVIQGKVYRASDWIIVDAFVSVPITLRCAMCNEPFIRNIELKRWVHEEEAPKNGILDLGESLREDILLEVPYFALCSGESCQHITEIKQFIRKESPHEGYKPFLAALE